VVPICGIVSDIDYPHAPYRRGLAKETTAGGRVGGQGSG
jgi:hypothetical protein